MTVASHETLHNIIRSRFKTEIEDAEGLPTQYDNEGEQPPDEALWCRFAIRTGESDQADIGGAEARERIPGVAFAQLFWPMERGDKAPLAMADKIAAKFRRITVSGVTFRTPSVVKVGREGNRWQVNVQCPFYADLG